MTQRGETCVENTGANAITTPRRLDTVLHLQRTSPNPEEKLLRLGPQHSKANILCLSVSRICPNAFRGGTVTSLRRFRGLAATRVLHVTSHRPRHGGDHAGCRSNVETNSTTWCEAGSLGVWTGHRPGTQASTPYSDLKDPGSRQRSVHCTCRKHLALRLRLASCPNRVAKLSP